MEIMADSLLTGKNAPLIMGIINCTPDSFYSGSRAETLGKALKRAETMISEGADILDIGGESTRPGSDYVDEEEELQRVIPVIRWIREISSIPISIDTRKSAVAREAIENGADIINDISGLGSDPKLGVFAAEAEVPVILMHMRGNPKTMQEKPYYRNTVKEIKKELREIVKRAVHTGVRKSSIILDPGIGFGKRVEDNLRIIRGIPELKKMGYPLLIGLSRKSFISRALGQGKDLPAEDRLTGSIAAHAYAVIVGADILRVHDVKETRDCIKMICAIREV